MTEHKETEELPLLIEGYKKEIWEWKQKESQWVKDQNKLEGSKRIIEELSTKIIELGKDNKRLADQLANRIEQLRKAGM
jgi:predicted RNase H-like nuclease (RuvC/YqgF family)|tara:strand:+ start:45 stop:281 length:237 start_codon:yes stop_codon:yes gene_type:complete